MSIHAKSKSLTGSAEFAAERERRDDAFSDIELEVVPLGSTTTEFRGHRICALRQYWDELTVFEQLGLLTP